MHISSKYAVVALNIKKEQDTGVEPISLMAETMINTDFQDCRVIFCVIFILDSK